MADNQMTADQIQEAIETARAEARAVCEEKGKDSQECAAAWDIVEELQASAAHSQVKAKANAKTSLQRFCDENPDAIECRIYED
jgi:hypothetical protein